MTAAQMTREIVAGWSNKETRALVLAGMADGARKVLMGLGVLLLGLYYYQHQDWRLTFTTTPSLDPGLYVYRLDDVFDLQRDQLVRYHYAAPQWVRDRKWTHRPETEWQLKRVRGIPGDRIEVQGRDVLVCPRLGGVQMPCEVAGRRLSIDRKGIPWPAAPFEGVVPADHFFVMGDHPLSFDSRYFGLIRRDQIAGRAQPIWTSPLPKEVFMADWESILREEAAARNGSPVVAGKAG